MAEQSPAQKKTIERVMHEFKHGELEKRDGEPVKNPKQAIAIALHEAGASSRESPAKNTSSLARTKRREREGRTEQAAKEARQAGAAPSRADLIAEARRRKIPGRSKMRKADLERALRA